MSKKLKVILIIVGTLVVLAIIALAFYWFSYRPAKIKHDCSWVKKHTEATPAIHEECLNKGSLGTMICETKLLSKSPLEPASKIAVPAEPAKDWYGKATKEEYDFCIRDKGL